MILCTVGTHNMPFDRLVTAMDEYAAITNETVVIQLGCSNYLPKNAEYFQFTTYEHMQALHEKARVVVSHAAAGAIILAIKLDKQLVVVPRSSMYGEHFDDHQTQLAKALKDTGQAVYIENPTPASLRDAIEHIKQQGNLVSGSPQLIKSIKEQLSAWNQ